MREGRVFIVWGFIFAEIGPWCGRCRVNEYELHLDFFTLEGREFGNV